MTPSPRQYEFAVLLFLYIALLLLVLLPVAWDVARLLKPQ